MRTAPCKGILFFALLTILNAPIVTAQRVGIGTQTPRQILHISAARDSGLLLLENRATLGLNTSTSLYFRNGSWFTASIKAVGQASNEARLSFYTFAAQDSSGLRERMTIMDDGRVGMGTSMPAAGLEIAGETVSQLTLTNTLAFGLNKTSALFFRTGPIYSGAIKTIGTSGSSARMGFFTFAGNESTDPQERMSITNVGNVGIGITNPELRLEVSGNGKFTAVNSNTAALSGTNTGASYLNIGVRGNSDALGVVGQALTDEGIGVLGYNLGGGGEPTILPGAGVIGYSRTGHGVFGRTTRSGGYAGVYGSAYGNETVGGLFTSGSSDGFTNTLALRTMGAVRMTGIGEANGRVLTSDGSGNATWQALPAAARGFSARLNSDVNLVSGTDFTLGSMTEIFDEGNIFSSGTNSFTAPETGMYQITFNARLFQVNANNTISFSSTFLVNGLFDNNSLYTTIHPATGSSSIIFGHTNTRLFKLAGGEVVTLKCVANFSTGSVTLRGGNFQGTTVLSIHQVK
jgi:hypothetical protein